MFHTPVLLLLLTIANLTLGQYDRTKGIAAEEMYGIEFEGYLATLYYKDKYLCGGSILSPRWILTAGNCLVGRYELDVFPGGIQRYRHGKVFKSRYQLIHPDFDTDTLDYDAGLVHIGTDVIPLDQHSTTSIKLIDSGATVPDNTEITMSGLKTIDYQGKTLYKLTIMKLMTLNDNTCKTDVPRLTDRRFCAMISPDMKLCKGFTGDPILEDGKQIGIVSFSYKPYGSICDDTHYPAVFTRVSDPSIRGWIKNETNI